MTGSNLKDVWIKAQKVEEKLCRRGAPHQTKKWWAENLSREYNIDYGFFKGKTVLEVGCGSHGMIHYIDTALSKVGSDPLCSNYQDFFIDWDSGVDHVTAAGENLPFNNGVFDIVICYNVIDHGISPFNILKEIERVLRPDGQFVFCVATFFNLPAVLRSYIRLADKPHPHHMSRRETFRFLHEAGFELDYYRYQGDPVGLIFQDLKGRLFQHAALRFFANILGRGTGYYICSKDHDRAGI